MVSLEDKVAVVTGAGRGIGKSIAAELASRGARVVVNDIGCSVEGHPDDERVAEEVVAAITMNGGAAVGHVADMSVAESARAAIDLALENWGRLDIVVNNAGTLRVSRIWEMSEDDWDSVIRSHATHTYALTHQACRHWREQAEAGNGDGGRIVNLVAATGLTGRHDMGTNHAAAKGAIAAFTVAVATEMLPYGVTVNAVSPAAVRTRMATHVGARLPDPINGFDSANPELVAPLVAYLASEEAGWISGQVFRLVGGKLGRYQPWTVAATLEKEDGWSAEDLQAGMPRLMGTYPGSIAIPP